MQKQYFLPNTGDKLFRGKANWPKVCILLAIGLPRYETLLVTAAIRQYLRKGFLHDS